MSSDVPVQQQRMVSEHQPLPVELRPSIDHILTEDGAPVDNQFSEKQQRLLTEILYCSWQPQEPFVAMSNVGLFFAVRTPPFVPDVLVSLGVSQSWLRWTNVDGQILPTGKELASSEAKRADKAGQIVEQLKEELRLLRRQ
jgi:hypothetical protein